MRSCKMWEERKIRLVLSSEDFLVTFRRSYGNAQFEYRDTPFVEEEVVDEDESNRVHVGTFDGLSSMYSGIKQRERALYWGFKAQSSTVSEGANMKTG